MVTTMCGLKFIVLNFNRRGWSHVSGNSANQNRRVLLTKWVCLCRHNSVELKDLLNEGAQAMKYQHAPDSGSFKCHSKLGTQESFVCDSLLSALVD
jgi:hypothetical protein